MLEDRLVELLIKNKMHISFAESCTAGLAVGTLVNVANASKVLDMSFITYANEAKVDLLGVNEATINKHGVVSEDVAGEMALGVAKKAKANVGVGISGIAGPTGATATKPIGMVCFGIAINGKLHTYTEYFGNQGRNVVRALAVDYIFESLISLLENL